MFTIFRSIWNLRNEYRLIEKTEKRKHIHIPFGLARNRNPFLCGYTCLAVKRFEYLGRNLYLNYDSSKPEIAILVNKHIIVGFRQG